MRKVAARTLGAMALLVVASSGALSACSAGTGVGLPEDWPPQRTFWSTSVTEDGRDRPLVAGTRVELRLGRDGELGAQAGCNLLGGRARIQDGRLVTDGALSQTDMGCDPDRMAQDTWLVNFLTGRPTWQLQGEELILTGGAVRITLLDREVLDPDRPLAGTRWVVDTIITGETASSVPPGATADLILDERGRLTGTTGCVAITGTAGVRADAIDFSIDTPAECDPAVASPLHAAVLATLVGDVRYEIEGPHLSLTAPSGAGLRLTASSMSRT